MSAARVLLALLIAGLPLAGCISDTASPAATVEPADLPVPDDVERLGAVALEPVFHPEVEAFRAAVQVAGAATVTAEPVYLLAGLDPRDTGPVSLDLELAPSSLLNDTVWVEIDGRRAQLPFVETYEGHLAGDPGSPARVTVAQDWVRGTVRIQDVTYRFRINMDGNFPKDADWDAVAPEPAQVRAALLRPDWTFDRDGVEPHDCLSLVPQPISPVVHVSGHEGETIVADIVLDSDAAFGDVFGKHTFPLLIAFVNEVDNIYAHEIGLRFRVVGLHAHTDPEALSDPEQESPLGGLADYWNARPDLGRDVVHLVTGLPSSYAQANCIGGAGMPDLAYTFSTVHWGKEEYGKHRHIQTYAHELGHILNAHHHYGNPVEGGVGTTIMHQGGQKVHPVFSTLSRSVIRGWIEAHVA